MDKGDLEILKRTSLIIGGGMVISPLLLGIVTGSLKAIGAMYRLYFYLMVDLVPVILPMLVGTLVLGGIILYIGGRYHAKKSK